MISITKKDIAWNYIGNIMNLGVSIFILPVVLRRLSAQELGLWYVFGSMATLVQMLDFGFSPAITRNITYAWSGAKELMTEGISEASTDGQPNYSLLGNLMAASKQIYFVISMVALVALLSIGSVYIKSLLPSDAGQLLMAWILYAFGIFFNIYFSYWSPMLRGLGKIKEINQATLVSKMAYIVLAIIGLSLGGGLVSLAAFYLLSALIFRLMSIMLFRKSMGQELDKVKPRSKGQTRDILRKIWPNARKQGIVTVGAWLTTGANTLICSSFLGLEVTSRYGLSLSLLGVINSVSNLLFSSYIPELASLKIQKGKERLVKVFSRGIAMQWVVSISGILALTFIGPPALSLIGSKSQLLPIGQLLILGIVLFLEWNHSTFATLITLSNKIPFVKSSLYSGSAIVILSVLSAKFTTLGILGLIGSQGLVQLAYNNWHWPRRALRENDMTIGSIINSSRQELSMLIQSLRSKRQPQ